MNVSTFKMTESPTAIRLQVPPATASVFWYTIKHLDNGTMLSFDVHTHADLARAIVFSGKPELVGLNQGEWKLSKPWQPIAIEPSVLQPRIAEFEAKIAERSEFVCFYAPNIETLEDGSMWFRRGYPNCTEGDFKLSEGQFSTVLGFFDTRPSARLENPEYFQHMSLMGLRVLDSGTAPAVGARITADRELWDEEVGVLRDWDLLRGFIVGGLGVTHEHISRVVTVLAMMISSGLLFSAALVWVCCCQCCGYGCSRLWSFARCRKTRSVKYSRVNQCDDDDEKEDVKAFHTCVR